MKHHASHAIPLPVPRLPAVLRLAGLLVLLAGLCLLGWALLELAAPDSVSMLTSPGPAPSLPPPWLWPASERWAALQIYGLALLFLGLLLAGQGHFQRRAAQLELEIDRAHGLLRLAGVPWPLEVVAGLEVLEPERRGRGIARPLGWRVMLRLTDGTRLALLEASRAVALAAAEDLARRTGLERVYGEPRVTPVADTTAHSEASQASGGSASGLEAIPRIDPGLPADSPIERHTADGGVRFRWTLEGTRAYRRFLLGVFLASVALGVTYDLTWLAVLNGSLEPPGPLFRGWSWPVALHLVLVPFAVRSLGRRRDERDAWEELLETPDGLRYTWSDGRVVSPPVQLSSSQRAALRLASAAPGHFHLEVLTPSGWVLIGRAIRGRTRLRAIDLAALQVWCRSRSVEA